MRIQIGQHHHSHHGTISYSDLFLVAYSPSFRRDGGNWILLDADEWSLHFTPTVGSRRAPNRAPFLFAGKCHGSRMRRLQVSPPLLSPRDWLTSSSPAITRIMPTICKVLGHTPFIAASSANATTGVARTNGTTDVAPSAKIARNHNTNGSAVSATASSTNPSRLVAVISSGMSPMIAANKTSSAPPTSSCQA